jgi:predicted nuclease of restriction endonuclease-like RecB superfamily
MYASRACRTEGEKIMTSTVVSPRAEATLKQVTEYFRREGETLKGFTEEWKQMSETDKTQIKQGLGNGTLTY